MQWEYFYQPPIWQLLAAFTCQINWHRACVFRSPESARELRTCNKCWWRSMDQVHLARNWEINLMDPFGSRCLQPSPHAEKCQISPALTTLPMRSSNKKLICCALSKQALSHHLARWVKDSSNGRSHAQDWLLTCQRRRWKLHFSLFPFTGKREKQIKLGYKSIPKLWEP